MAQMWKSVDGAAIVGTESRWWLAWAHAIAVSGQLTLTGLGWKPAVARRAVEQAARELGPDIPLEPLIRRALQRCN